MTDEQKERALRITDEFRTLAYRKYEKGALEHSGNLWEMDPRELAREIRAEAIDQYVYVHDLINWVDKLVSRITVLEAELAEAKKED